MIWFDGETYNDSRDRERLQRQLYRVWRVLYLHRKEWLTLQDIHKETGDPLQSISARLRDFRKARFGGHDIQRRHRLSPEKCLFEYRLRA
jgi:hypothetical protein